MCRVTMVPVLMYEQRCVCRATVALGPDSNYVYSSCLVSCKGICCFSFCKLLMIPVDDKAIVPVGSPNRPE